jgi:hypothetical protein
MAIPIQISFELTPPTSPFEIRCENGFIHLYRTEDGSSVSEWQLNGPGECYAWAESSPNGTAVAFVTVLQEVYVWRADGTPPLNVGTMSGPAADYQHPHWSPDGKHLAFITLEEVNVWPHTATVRVVEDMGEFRLEFQIAGGGTDGEDIYWLANNVICRGDRNTVPCHKVSTGEYLFDVQGWHIITSGGVPGQQPPSCSPDQRWCLLDNSYFGSRWYQASYALHDIQQTRAYALPSTGSNQLAFASWTNDSSAAYLISLPREANSTPAPDVPFGLLKLDVQTRQLEVLFEQAVHVAWSPDQQWAFVIFPARAADGSLELQGSIWRVGTEELGARVLISREMIYSNPGWESYFRGPDSFGAPVWSHNNRWVVTGDAHGGLHLLGTDGATLQLSSDESGASWLSAEFTWSSDDHYLLVKYGERIWIVSIP